MKQFKKTGAALGVLVAVAPLTVGAEEATTTAAPTTTASTTAAPETSAATTVAKPSADGALISVQNKDASNGDNLALNVPFTAKIDVPVKNGDMSAAKLAVKLGKDFQFATETVTNAETNASATVSKIRIMHGDTVFREVDTESLPKNSDGSLDFSLDLTAQDVENGKVSVQVDLIAPKGDNMTRTIAAELKAGNYTSKTSTTIEFTDKAKTDTPTTTTEASADTTAAPTDSSNGSETTAAPTDNSNGSETTVEANATGDTSAATNTSAPADGSTTQSSANGNVASNGSASNGSTSNGSVSNGSASNGSASNGSASDSSSKKRLPNTGVVALGGSILVGAAGLVGTLVSRKRKGH